MMKIKTSELSGAALHFAVAIAEGWQDWEEEDYGFSWHNKKGSAWLTLDSFRPSEFWEQGGPIIEREKIDVFYEKHTTGSWVGSAARGNKVGWRYLQYGTTPLVAAMRCYVASKLGDTVDVPDELKGAE